MKLTVTRALAELKLLDSRIDKLTDNMVFVSLKKSGQKWKDHVDETKSEWQSVNDLITRYNNIKFAVLKSNSLTTVKVNGKEYTVTEAIAMKECMRYKSELLQKMREERDKVNKQLSDHEENVQKKLDNLLELNFQKDKKTDEKDIKAISDAYQKNNWAEVVDPLKIDKKISELEEECDNFSKEVDFVLSESNALTHIELD